MDRPRGQPAGVAGPSEGERCGRGSCGSVHRGDSDEIAVRVRNHECAAEGVVVRLLNDVDALCDPSRDGLVNCGRRPGDHQPDLGERLEVSRRTVLRDVEALSLAGVPVCAERGRNGGIVLLPGARLSVSHLEPEELEALSIAGLDDEHLERLGLTAVHETAARKIAARQARVPGPRT